LAPQAEVSFGLQEPLQLCWPEGHAPTQAVPVATHMPLHSEKPVLHAGTHARPLHETVPLVGAVHGELHALVPQLSIAVLLTHLRALEPASPHA
jgi:hypothetical protein